GEGIEFLLVDVIKSAELARAVVQTFFPALLPGAAVVQQDFAHYYTSWLHLIHYHLRDHFAPLLDLPESCGLVFRLTRPLSRDEVADCGWLLRPSPEEVRQAFAYSLGLVAPAKRPRVAAAEVMMSLHLARWGEAGEALARHRGGCAGDADFAAVEDLFGR